MCIRDRIYLLAYIDLLKQTNPEAVWMIAGLQVNLRGIFSTCLEAGGHIRTGLEDSYFYSETANLELVRQTTKIVLNENYEIGTAAQLRQQLG